MITAIEIARFAHPVSGREYQFLAQCGLDSMQTIGVDQLRQMPIDLRTTVWAASHLDVVMTALVVGMIRPDGPTTAWMQVLEKAKGLLSADRDVIEARFRNTVPDTFERGLGTTEFWCGWDRAMDLVYGRCPDEEEVT